MGWLETTFRINVLKKTKFLANKEEVADAMYTPSC